MCPGCITFLYICPLSKFGLPAFKYVQVLPASKYVQVLPASKYVQVVLPPLNVSRLYYLPLNNMSRLYYLPLNILRLFYLPLNMSRLFYLPIDILSLYYLPQNMLRLYYLPLNMLRLFYLPLNMSRLYCLPLNMLRLYYLSPIKICLICSDCMKPKFLPLRARTFFYARVLIVSNQYTHYSLSLNCVYLCKPPPMLGIIISNCNFFVLTKT